jgi:hypothetical protein
VPDLPHFSLPFRFETWHGETVIPATEQDGADELGDCVELALRTEQGQRRTLPGFGRPETLAFMTDRELARSLVQQTIDDAEPRVKPFVQQAALDLADPGVARLLTMYESEVEEEEAQE